MYLLIHFLVLSRSPFGNGSCSLLLNINIFWMVPASLRGPWRECTAGHEFSCSSSKDGKEFQMKEVQIAPLCQGKQIQSLSYGFALPNPKRKTVLKWWLSH